MKSMKVLIPLIFVVSMLFPMALFAQEATPEAGTPLNILQVLELVRAAYGTDAVITEISFYHDAEDDDEFQTACWHFEFADGTELCVDAYTGAIVVDDLEAEETPEATDDSDDDSNDDEDVNDDDEDVNDDDEDVNDDDEDSNDDEDDSDDSDDSSDDIVTVTPLVSLEDAIAIALSIFPNSIVTNADLEVLDDGTVVWDIELDNDARSVDIDANTGAVLDFGYEEDDDNGYAEDDDSDDDSNDDEDDSNDDEDVNDDEDDSDDDSEDDDSEDDDSEDDDSEDDGSEDDGSEDDDSDTGEDD